MNFKEAMKICNRVRIRFIATLVLFGETLALSNKIKSISFLYQWYKVQPSVEVVINSNDFMLQLNHSIKKCEWLPENVITFSHYSKPDQWSCCESQLLSAVIVTSESGEKQHLLKKLAQPMLQKLITTTTMAILYIIILSDKWLVLFEFECESSADSLWYINDFCQTKWLCFF